jgi:uncharacterized HAD superfamily protein
LWQRPPEDLQGYQCKGFPVGSAVLKKMTTTKTIYVDMDDVLCQTARKVLGIIERQFGKQVAYEQLVTFDLGRGCGLQPGEIAELFRIVHHPDELLSIEPMAGAIAVLNQWVHAGYEIAIVTGRPPTTYEPSLEWLARHQLPYHAFVVVDKYGRFTTENTIGITLPELANHRFCFAVEDSLTMAKYLANEMQVPVALFDHPWNRTELELPIIRRCNDWQNIAKVLPSAVTS